MSNAKLKVIFGVVTIILLIVIALLWQQSTLNDALSDLLLESPDGELTSEPTVSIPIQNLTAAAEVSPTLMTVKVFFGSEQSPSGEECTTVNAVNRQIARTDGVARATLEALLEGPTLDEKNRGYFTSINAGVEIQKIVIENRVAKVDFTSRLEDGVGGSCRVTAIRSQITQTLLQFPTIDEVVISVDGRIEDVLQP